MSPTDLLLKQGVYRICNQLVLVDSHFHVCEKLHYLKLFLYLNFSFFTIVWIDEQKCLCVSHQHHIITAEHSRYFW